MNTTETVIAPVSSKGSRTKTVGEVAHNPPHSLREVPSLSREGIQGCVPPAQRCGRDVCRMELYSLGAFVDILRCYPN